MVIRIGDVCGRLFILVALLGLFITPGMAQPIRVQNDSDRLKRSNYSKPKEVSQEVLDVFGEGISEEEFLSLANGQVRSYGDEIKEKSIIVILEMERDPLAMVYVENLTGSAAMISDLQAVYEDSLNRAQEAVVLNLESL